ncbi:MAG: valine--tRNA ligase [Elusimicrobia bacterium]|nr:valine--tRNA ligase [Elusimicrobiota bacterium]
MLEKAYDPKPVEEKRLASWDAAQLSRSVPGAKPPFTIVIPPPNVTGALHIGHALNNSLQDAFIRHHRMKGEEACWVPGCDHGGIATQNVMEKQLKAEKIDRHALGRDAFLERMQVWTRDCKKTILGQLHRLGASLDWKREAFTMDEERGKAVFHAFKTLWERGLIYRGERLVNWCVRCGTALSDIEVEREERKGALYHIHYPLEGGGEGAVVATTRPITMFGDTAVAINPKDKRWTHLIGKRVLIPFTNRSIPIIEDTYVDFEFGTGCLKVTPAHDQNDWEIGQRHKLPAIKVLGRDGKLTDWAGQYAGLSREKAHDQVIADLESEKYLRKKEDHKSAVQICYRCSSIIEPLLSFQWFVNQIELAKAPLKALDSGEFKIYPTSWVKPYRDWLVNIKDWCVSRQIWWGHRIPVWYCLTCTNPIAYLGTEVQLKSGKDAGMQVKQYLAGSILEGGISFDELLALNPFFEFEAGKDVDAKSIASFPGLKVSQTKPDTCKTCGKNHWYQDSDVLDTWFSSALWPLAVFGWPEKTKDLAYYYPTSTLVTGYEILYLWVARMQMMGHAFMDKPAFPDAVIHGIVRDKSGKKMSKSLGNVIDPLVMMEKHGTDALRFALMAQAHPGKDIAFDEQTVVGARNFVNKLWNSTRFVLMNLPETPAVYSLGSKNLEFADRWILSRYQRVVSHAQASLDAYDPAAAAQELYVFLWDEFCAWYIELAKGRLTGAEGESKDAVRAILVHILAGSLKALHPIMPFVTEELYAEIKAYAGESAEFILRGGYPVLDGSRVNPEVEKEMSLVMGAVTSIRSLRSQLNVPPGLKIKAVAEGPFAAALLGKHRAYALLLAQLESLEPMNGGRPAQSATAVADGVTFHIPLAGVIDFAKERERLAKDLAKAEGDIEKCAAKLKNLSAAASAPAEKVAEAKEQHDAAAARRDRLKETIAVLS